MGVVDRRTRSWARKLIENRCQLTVINNTARRDRLIGLLCQGECIVGESLGGGTEWVL